MRSSHVGHLLFHVKELFQERLEGRIVLACDRFDGLGEQLGVGFGHELSSESSRARLTISSSHVL